MQDTISYTADNDNLKSSEIDSPLFIIPDSLKNDSNPVSFKQYISILNEHSPTLIERKSLFANKNYYINKELKTTERNSNNTPGWIFGIIFISIIVYFILIKTFYSKIKLIVKGIFSNVAIFSVAVLLFSPIFSLLVYAPLFYYKDLNYSFFDSDFGNFVLIFLLCIIYFVLKYALIYFFGLSFRFQSLCSKYNFNQTFFYLIGGLLLIPFVFLFYFLPNLYQYSLLITILIVACILFVIRLLRGFAIVFNHTKASQFYLFVYLCTVEFLPLVVIYKYIYIRIN